MSLFNRAFTQLNTGVKGCQWAAHRPTIAAPLLKNSTGWITHILNRISSKAK